MNYLSAAHVFFKDSPSGSARVAWDMAQLMRERGHNVTLFCSRQKSCEEVAVYDDINVVGYHFGGTFSLDPFKVRKQINAGLACAAKHLSNIKWDVVHIHLPIEGSMLYKLFGSGPKYVYTVHSPSLLEQQINWSAQGLPGRVKLLFGKRPLKKLEGGLLKKVHKIHTLSQYTKNAIDDFYSVAGKTTVIPHWCRKDFFRQHDKNHARTLLDWPENAKILFSVRRLAPRMGLDIALRAIAPLMKRFPNVIFAIAGAGLLESSLKQLAQHLEVTDRIWFLGRVSDEKLKRCYEAADLFILPTMALECFGLPVLEALAYGLPIISTDAAAIPELMRPILPQCIVPAGSIEKLKEKLTEYLDGNLDLPSSEKLIDHVQKYYGKPVIVPRIIEWLET